MTHTFYDDYGMYLGSAYEQKIVAWMTAHDHPGYANEIFSAAIWYSETISDAGQYWSHCEFTRNTLDLVNTELKEIYSSATDRYEDWATD